MERVETLLQKLQQQVNEKLSVDRLLLTVQMMQHELTHLQGNLPLETNKATVVSMPLQTIINQPLNAGIIAQVSATAPVTEEKTVAVLQVDEAEVEAELEEIKRNASLIQNISSHSKPPMYLEPLEDDIPTLIHQELPVAPINAPVKEVNEWASKESRSINEYLNQPATEISAKLSDGPVKDLKKAIGINDRFLYINELFRGDEAMYERSIKTINSFTIWPEAEYWIRRELKTKLGWVDSTPTVKQFDQLVRRRFS